MRAARSGIVCAAFASVGIAAAAACGAFGGGGPTPDDGGTSADAPEATPGVDVGTDAATCALGDSPSIVAKTNGAPSKVATDGAHVFWIEGGARLMRASLLDCTTREIATGTISALAADTDSVVWGVPEYRSLPTSDVAAPPYTATMRVDPTVVVRGDAYWLDSANGNIVGCQMPCIGTYNSSRVSSPKLLALNVTKVFFFGVHPDAGTTLDLWWRGIGGPQLNGPLATNQDPRLLAATSDRAVWVSSDGHVVAVLASGGPLLDLGSVTSPRAIAADDAFVYITADAEILRVSVLGGATPTSFASTQARPVSIVLTGDQVIWANADDQTIRRRRK